MKKILCTVIAAFLIICGLSGCIPAAEDITPELSPALSTETIAEPSLVLPTEPAAESSPVPSMEPVTEPSLSVSAEPTQKPSLPPAATAAVEPSSGPAFNVADEPPLDERSLSITVPDFLDEEQQLLYRKAYRLYEAMFGGSSSGIDIPRISGQPKLPSMENATVAYAGNNYIVSTGRYSDWDDFSMVIYSVYTDEFWKHMNQLNGVERYVNVDGRMCYLDLGRGSGRLYLGQPDEFELVSQTDDSIIFTLIGHYGQAIEDGGNGKNYTIKFPMKLVKTENGWRFEEFHSALWEQQVLDE